MLVENQSKGLHIDVIQGKVTNIGNTFICLRQLFDCTTIHLALINKNSKHEFYHKAELIRRKSH